MLTLIAIILHRRFELLFGLMVYSSGFLSSVLDNTVVVASYIPTIQSLVSLHVSLKPLWWAVLFGACYGGNITMIGSTANIVAVDILEKQTGRRINFSKWPKMGLAVGVFSMTIAFVIVLLFI